MIGQLQGAFKEELKSFESASIWDQIKRVDSENLTWSIFRSRKFALPEQGWKVHVSLTAVGAAEALRNLRPILAKYESSFKIPDSLAGVIYLNSGKAGPTQVGKIITIYPESDAACAALAQQIDVTLGTTDGPIIVSDLRLNKRSSVFIRFGAFGAGPVLADEFGVRDYYIRSPTGDLIQDRRHVSGDQVPWATPPIKTLERRNPTLDLLKKCRRRFLTLKLLQSAPKGQVFMGVDLKNYTPVVMKIGNKGVGGDLFNNDAQKRIHNEIKILQLLRRSSPDYPTVISYYEVPDANMVVLSDVGGVPLDRVSEDVQFRGLSALARATQRLHSAGIVHRDVKLQNVLIEEPQGNREICARLIDFDIAASVGNERLIAGGTRGYADMAMAGQPASTCSDIFSLGGCLASTILKEDVSGIPGGVGQWLGLLSLHGHHRAVELVKILTAAPHKRPTINEVIELFEQYSEVSHRIRRTETNNHWAYGAVLAASQATRNFVTRAEKGAFWASSHPKARTASKEVGVGASGIILSLMTIRAAFSTDRFDDDIAAGATWLAAQNPEEPCIGFFSGRAGIGLTLALCGRAFKKASWVDASCKYLSLESASRKCFDLTFGLAGLLWALVLCAKELDIEPPASTVKSILSTLDAHRVVSNEIPVWATFDPNNNSISHFLGAAHGSAGIAMALGAWADVAADRILLADAADIFKRLYEYGRHTTGYLFLSTERPDLPSPGNQWCHGLSGWLWALLQSGIDTRQFAREIDWAVAGMLKSQLPTDPTCCHGLTGQLELLRMMAKVSYNLQLEERRRIVFRALRNLRVHSPIGKIWASDEVEIITPDLWLGFMGPAASVALELSGCPFPMFHSNWLRLCRSR